MGRITCQNDLWMKSLSAEADASTCHCEERPTVATRQPSECFEGAQDASATHDSEKHTFPAIGRPIATMNEKPLHAALKEWYAQPGDRVEVPVDGSQIDLVRGDLLIEIQTGNFTAIRRKLNKLVEKYPLRLVYPIAAEKWIVRLKPDGKGILSRRRSPKRGRLEHVFEELVRAPHFLKHENFSLEILMIREEEVRTFDAGRAWRRRGWLRHERRLLEVVSRHVFETPHDLMSLVPEGLPEPFSTADLARVCNIPRWIAQKMAYCFRAMESIEMTGKKGNAILYRLVPAPAATKRKRRPRKPKV